MVFTGGFDPIHSGHIRCINQASKMGRLVIGLNSDQWLIRKKGRPFMPFTERKAVLDQFRDVTTVIGFDDSDGSACDAIAQARQMFPDQRIIFVNGGDRTATNIPEMERFANDPQVEFLFGIGGDDKANSSSWILEEWRAPKTLRSWGYYRVLYEPNSRVKLKELTVDPGCSLSMQRHQHRSEIWFVSEGTATLERANDMVETYKEGQTIFIDQHSWHRLSNSGPAPLKVIEIQHGARCVEEDIERR